MMLVTLQQAVSRAAVLKGVRGEAGEVVESILTSEVWQDFSLKMAG